MKKITLLLSLAFLTFSCSDDDDGGSDQECTTCEVFGEEITFCDNEDGTYSIESNGQSEVVELEEGETFEDVTAICQLDGLDLGDLDLDLGGLE